MVYLLYFYLLRLILIGMSTENPFVIFRISTGRARRNSESNRVQRRMFRFNINFLFIYTFPKK